MTTITYTWQELYKGPSVLWTRWNNYHETCAHNKYNEYNAYKEIYYLFYGYLIIV